MNFAFAGCGFMGIYHIGVASCLRENAPHLLNGKLAGASAGAMVACLVLCESPLGLCTRWTLRLATKARSRSLGPMHPTFDITQLLRDGLHEILPANAHEIVNGRLHVSMTRVSDGKNIVVNEFDSRDELIQALLCSAFIPFYSGLVPPSFRGERCIDGALSNNLPILDEHTVTVSPFAGRSDICPDDDCANFLHIFLANTSIQFSVSNLYRLSRIMFPPHPEKLSAICQRGFDDTLLYLKRNDLTTCVRHISTKPPLSRSRTVYRGLNELDGTNCESRTCPDCASSKDKAVALLPRTVVSALNEAIEVVNSSYVLYIKNTKFYRTFSIMCSPLYLPLDIALLSVIKIIRYMPRVTKDLRQLLQALMFYASVAAGKLAADGRCSFTARLVCRLAIREIRKEALVHSAADNATRSRRGRALRSLDIGFGAGMTSGSLHALPESQGRCSCDGTASYETVTFGLSPTQGRSRAGSEAARVHPTSLRPSRASSSEALSSAAAVLGYYSTNDNGQVTVTEVYNVTKILTSQVGSQAPSRGGSGSATPVRRLRRTVAEGGSGGILPSALNDALLQTVGGGSGCSAFARASAESRIVTDEDGGIILQARADTAPPDATSNEEGSSWDEYLCSLEEQLC